MNYKDVPEYEGLYAINEASEIIGLYRYRKILKQVNRKGYLYVNLCNGNSIKCKSVARLVAQTFIPNPENKPTVNHKNGIKTDNRLENLEWATNSENTQHAFDNGLAVGKFRSENHFSRYVLCRSTGIVYDSILDAYESSRASIPLWKFYKTVAEKNGWCAFAKTV